METVNYFVPVKARFTKKQMKQICDAWREKWNFLSAKDDEISEEDVLIEAENLGFIELPEGWKT